MNSTGNAQETLGQMAADLAAHDKQLYGLDCSELKNLSTRFEAVLNGIKDLDISGLDLTGAINTVNTANAVDDWHTWSEGVTDGDVTTYTCEVCGAVKTEETQATIGGESYTSIEEAVTLRQNRHRRAHLLKLR